ncbi:serine hydrolase [Chryseomicrobium palamuruense]
MQASFAVVDAKSGRILAEQEAAVKMPPASITKIWTVYVALQESTPDEQVRISRNASNQEGSSVYLKKGDVWSLESLLYATMLQSGNDAAVAVAEHVAGSEEAFVELMNLYVKTAGVQNTWFMNPSGLHHEQHLTTAEDMARLFRVAIKDPKFREITNAASYNPIERSFYWPNKHRLVASGEAIAGKTGFTKAAGRTLISYFEEDDKQLIIVTLAVSNDWEVYRSLKTRVFNEVERVVMDGDYSAQDGIKISIQEPYAFLKRKDEKLTNIVYLKKGQTNG